MSITYTAIPGEYENLEDVLVEIAETDEVSKETIVNIAVIENTIALLNERKAAIEAEIALNEETLTLVTAEAETIPLS